MHLFYVEFIFTDLISLAWEECLESSVSGCIVTVLEYGCWQFWLVLEVL